MELLIVMAIIAILSLLAIASISVYTKRANALSAVNSLQKIVQAQMMYEESYPANGMPALWRRWAAIRTPVRPRRQARNCCRRIWHQDSSRDTSSAIACGDKVTSNNVDRFNSFTVIAKPQSVGKTGDRGYCADETDQIKFDPDRRRELHADAWPMSMQTDSDSTTERRP